MKCQVLDRVRFAAPAVLLALGWCSAAGAQQYIPIPGDGQAYDVTPDGNIVVGTATGGSFIWRWRQDPAPTLIPGGKVIATSDDGSVLAGTIVNPTTNKETAAIWTQAGGWQSLGGPAGSTGCDAFLSSAFGISGDGTTVAGLAWVGCQAQGFRWTAATGMQVLQNLANGSNRCNAISRNGAAMGGFAQGNSNRTPAYWGPGLTGFVIDANYDGETQGFDNNGNRSVGSLDTGTVNGAYVRNQQTGATTNLGTLHAGWTGNATDLSEDGNVIVGWDNLSLAAEAWVWTSGDGIVSLQNRLTSAGVPNVPTLRYITGRSDDGSVIVGGNIGLPGFIAELPILVPFGAGTAGCTGFPVLTATPTPNLGEASFTLRSTNAPPSSLGLVLVTNAADVNGSDPFALGVVLHVDLFLSTDTSTVDAFSDPLGIGAAAAPIPNNPALVGLTYYAQILWAWSPSTCFTPPFNLSTTNGLGITIQP